MNREEVEVKVADGVLGMVIRVVKAGVAFVKLTKAMKMFR
jgi:hypothetical protein